MKFKTIADIQQHQFIGNHASDWAAFNAIENFVADTSNTLADRAEALRVMSDRGMGLGRDEDRTNEQMVQDWYDDCIGD